MNADTFTAEHRNWQWELALSFEDGSLPAAQWNEATLAVVAGWYATNLAPADARARYALHYKRNRDRLTHRLGSASVDEKSMAELDAVWESLLTRELAIREQPPRDA